MTPQPLGRRDILLGGGKILGVAEAIDPPGGIDCRVVDAAGLFATPGILDAHVHTAGAGGDGGPISRTPEIAVGDLIEAGTTTCVGCLGTDGFTRTVGSVVMKAKSLRAEGLSAYCYTGSYQVPPPTLTGAVETDLCYLDEVLGVGETAVADHRSSSPTALELRKLLKSAHVGGVLSGKRGVVHVHMGDGPDPFRVLYDAAEDSQLPLSKFYPTHINRNSGILEQAREFGKKAPVDITVGAGLEGRNESIEQNAWDAVTDLLQAGVPLEHITMSSDAGGTLPVFDDKGAFVGAEVAKPKVLLRTVQKMIREKILTPEQAFSLVTSTPARILGLSNKGVVKAGVDGDLLLFDQSWELAGVIAMGELWSLHGEPMKSSFFGH